MAKFLVETTGSFMLVDYSTGCEIRSQRPSVVEDSSFISSRAHLGQLKLLGALSAEATDAEFSKYWMESGQDAALAIESFMSAYGADAVSSKGKQIELELNPVEPEPEPEPDAKKGRKAK